MADLASPAPARPSWLRRILTSLLLFFILVGALVAVRFMWVTRDRFPGYTVEVAVDGRSATTDPRPLKIGFGEVDITPDISNPDKPVWLAGFSQNRSAVRINDPLVTSALVLDNGHARVGIVAIDSIGFFHDDVIRVRERVPADWKLDYVVVCSTHNHSTPDLMGLWGPSILKSGVDPAYKERVIQSCVTAVGQAITGLTPARMAIHEIPVDPAGLVKDTRKPEVYDADLRLLHFTHATNGSTLGTLVGWGNHPETPWAGSRDITADFPGVIRTALANGIPGTNGLFRPGIGGRHLFVNGAVGGLMTTHPSTEVTNPVTGELLKTPSHEKTLAVGHQLVMRILDRIRSTNAPSVDSAPLTVHARTHDIRLENNGFLLASLLGLLDRGHSKWMHFRTEVALITLGDASFACIPGEIYPEIVNGGVLRAPGGDFDIEPLEVPPLRELMPGRIRFVFGLANDEIGYIIPKSEWDVKAPYLFDAPSSPYGEVNSCGPDTALLIHQSLRERIEEWRSGQAPAR
jgi:hypothetical protein